MSMLLGELALALADGPVCLPRKHPAPLAAGPRQRPGWHVHALPNDAIGSCPRSAVA